MATTGAIGRFWVVGDPGPQSEIQDAVFETDLAGFALQIRGGFDPDRAKARAYGSRAEALIELVRRAESQAEAYTDLAFEAALEAALEIGPAGEPPEGLVGEAWDQLQITAGRGSHRPFGPAPAVDPIAAPEGGPR